jgi:polyhydroxybutyrate depolymerase
VTEGVPVMAGGKARTYVLSVPPAYDAARAYPLVFVFHSGGRTGASARDYFSLAGIAEGEAIVVYPDGLSGEWDLESPAAKNPDVALFDAILASTEATLCVDAARVFATGSSMGAYFVNQLGCRRGSKLRAIAPHSGSGPYDAASAYDDEGHLRCPDSPVAAMIFHGDKDTSVALADGKASRDHWAWANGCKGAPAPTEPSPCVAYTGCARPVLWCQIPGGTHRIWADGPKATWHFFQSF